MKKGGPIAEYDPQLAQLFDEPPAGEQWLHEIKLDGYRIGCLIQRGGVALLSRRNNEWTDHFPEVVAYCAFIELDYLRLFSRMFVHGSVLLLGGICVWRLNSNHFEALP